MSEQVARAIRAGLISPNVRDSNLEPANVVDALADLARAIVYVGDQLGQIVRVQVRAPGTAPEE